MAAPVRPTGAGSSRQRHPRPRRFSTGITKTSTRHRISIAIRNLPGTWTVPAEPSLAGTGTTSALGRPEGRYASYQGQPPRARTCRSRTASNPLAAGQQCVIEVNVLAGNPGLREHADGLAHHGSRASDIGFAILMRHVTRGNSADIALHALECGIVGGHRRQLEARIGI